MGGASRGGCEAALCQVHAGGAARARGAPLGAVGIRRVKLGGVIHGDDGETVLMHNDTGQAGKSARGACSSLTTISSSYQRSTNEKDELAMAISALILVSR